MVHGKGGIMPRENKGPGYSQCPGVPEMNHECSIKIRSRNMCPSCEKIMNTGKINGGRRWRCPGVPAVGHSCNTMRYNRTRCRTCEGVWSKHQNHLKKLDTTRIERWCLKCNRKFTASNRFLRLCKSCREGNRSIELNGYDETQYGLAIARRDR